MTLEMLSSDLKVKYSKETYTLAAGESQSIFYYPSQGVMEMVMVNSNNKDVRICVTTDGHYSSYTFAEAFALGLVFPASQVAYLTQYDTDNDVYCAVWAPVPVWEFKRQFEVSIKNEGSSTASVTVQLLLWTKE